MGSFVPELLAPAGNIDILKKAALSGADAVYFGGELFGARAYAGNFNEKEIQEAIRFLHLHGKKAYLTVNTLLKNREIEDKLFLFLKSLYEEGLDSVLVQDMGVLSLVRDCFPEMEIHASTQMGITGIYGVRFLEKLGISRVVLSRELSISEIERISKASPVETEVFVHGALCVSYSGRCLLSSMIGGRSANRGRCGGPCRLPYEVIIDGKKVRLPGNYPLSLKDLCGLDDLYDLCCAGVSSLKIEGRMKSSEYVSGVVSVYRKYLDMIAEKGEAPGISESVRRLLFSLGNRGGFTDGYLREQETSSMVSIKDSSFITEKTASGNFKEQDNDGRLPVRMSFSAEEGKPLYLKICLSGDERAAELSCGMCETAKDSATESAVIEEKLRKTGGTYFAVESTDISLSEKAFVPMSALNSLKREGLKKLEELLLSGSFRKTSREEPPELEYNDGKKPFHAIKDLPFYASVSTFEQLEVLKNRAVQNILLPAFLLMKESAVSRLYELKDSNTRLYLIMPPVIRERFGFEEKMNELFSLYRQFCFSGVFASSLDALSYLSEHGIEKKEVFFSPDIYVMNDRAAAFFRNAGYENQALPAELNAGELKHRNLSGAIFTAYGRVPVMRTADCIFRNVCPCERTEYKKESCHTAVLKDRTNESFPVMRDCFSCVNTIYNSVPTCLFDKLFETESFGLNGIRLDFTVEEPDEVSLIMDYLQRILKGSAKKAGKPPFPYTRGHFSRGVE